MLMALPGVMAHARVHHSDAWARERFAAAERMREALNGRPPNERTRHDYQRVINAYRDVYFGAPTSSKADPSVVAVAETLVEMGRRFDDDKILNEAIAQYKFLRREYPGSKYRCDALFTVGEIYKDDLNDPEQARSVFQEFVHRYPNNRLAEDAQQAVADLDRQAAAEKKAEARKKSGKETSDKGKTANQSPAEDVDANADSDASPSSSGQEAIGSSEPRSGKLARVTGIRHWSTPDYTRVAIDLESGIKFGSQRIASPDRIFFDLRGTKLASTLVGKSFDVDDGFLKKIRVAQFKPGRTRVVLEVDDLSDYEAFLLPNPYRLIIDIHGKDAKKSSRAKEEVEADTATADVEAPPKAGTKAEPKEVAKSVPPSELKADMKALAGKPVTRSEQIHDDQKVPYKDVPESTKKPAVDSKTSIVKKVVVEADDDDVGDAPPVKVAKLDHPAGHTRSSATSAAPANKDDSADAESAPEDTSATSSNSGSRPRGKSSSRLSKKQAADLGMREAKPTASGDRSLIRALGLKIGRIVIDPGHGGHDTGTIGPNGLEEKDLVLEVGRRLGKIAGDQVGGGSRLHAQGRYVHPAGDANCHRQPATCRSFHFDSCQLEPRFCRARRGNLLFELHVFSGSPGSGGAGKCGLREIHLRAAGPGQEDRDEGEDRRVPRIRRRCAGITAHRACCEDASHPQPGSEESTLHCAYRRQHAIDSGGDFLCQQSGGRASPGHK